MALVVRDLMSAAAWGLAEHAASKEAAKALLDDTSSDTPAAAHNSLTCQIRHEPLHCLDDWQRPKGHAVRRLKKQAEDITGNSASTEVVRQS